MKAGFNSKEKLVEGRGGTKMVMSRRATNEG